MKKNFVVLALGSPAILWVLSKLAPWIYKKNPELCQFIARDVLLPEVKNLIVDIGTSAIYRAVYGETRSGIKYVPNHRPLGPMPVMKSFSSYDHPRERRRTHG